jgi:hypothetical protein
LKIDNKGGMVVWDGRTVLIFDMYWDDFPWHKTNTLDILFY